MSDIKLKKDGNVVRDGRAEIDRYLAAEMDLSEAKRRMNGAECEMKNATNALGKWLCPDNAAPGEKFCVWHQGALLQAICVDLHTYDILIRQRAKP